METKECKGCKIVAVIALMIIFQLLFSTAYGVIATEVTPQRYITSKALDVRVNTSKQTYTGKYIKPSVKIYNGNVKLVEGEDYTVSYKNNKNTGKAYITVTGIGNYKGSFTKSFYIVPGKTKIKKVGLSAGNTKATITWNKDKQASGYAIYMSTSKNGKYSKVKVIKSNKTTKYVKTKLKASKYYYFKIRSFKVINGKRIYSNVYSNAKSAPKLIKKVTLKASHSTANRNYNLKKASNKINGTVLKSGETFNWFKVVGPASKAKGYKQAIVFSNGKSKMGYGGGVCQVSTTLYQTAKKVGLKIVERHQHSLPVSYTTKGKDATVSYGVQNLRIKNNKNYSIRIITTASGNTTTCKIYRID